MSDDERTHLILDAVPEEDSGAERPPPESSRPPSEKVPPRATAYDPERTHLILDPIDVAEEDDSGAERPLPPSRRPASDAAPARAPGYDPERTHLILDPVDVAEEEDGALADPGPIAGTGGFAPTVPAPASSRPPASASAPPSSPPLASASAPVRPEHEAPSAGDDQPTRLFIDAAALKSVRAADAGADDQKTHLFIPAGRREPDDARAAASPASSRRDGAARAEPVRDDRTRLMLGPVVVKDEPISVPPASTAKRGWLGERLERLGVAVDELMHDRWAIALVAAAIVCGLLAPLTGGTDESSGESPSALPSLAFLLGLVAFGLSWRTRLPGDGEGGKVAAAIARLQGALRLLVADLEALSGAPRNLKLYSFGQLLALLGFGGLIVSSGIGLCAALIDAGDGPTGVAFGSGLLLLVGVSATQFARRASVVAPAPDELGESVSAARNLAALVDLSDSLPPSFIDGHTSLHRILIALSQWRAGPWPDEASYLDALERHFQRHLPASQIERDKWLGRTRRDGVASLVIDDMVTIEVAQRFTPAAAARALARVSELAPKWSGKPMILAIFEAPREAVFQSAATSSLVNLHDDFPLIAVRIPDQRP